MGNWATGSWLYESYLNSAIPVSDLRKIAKEAEGRYAFTLQALKDHDEGLPFLTREDIMGPHTD